MNTYEMVKGRNGQRREIKMRLLVVLNVVCFFFIFHKILTINYDISAIAAYTNVVLAKKSARVLRHPCLSLFELTPP